MLNRGEEDPTFTSDRHPKVNISNYFYSPSRLILILQFCLFFIKSIQFFINKYTPYSRIAMDICLNILHTLNCYRDLFLKFHAIASKGS